MSLLQKKIDYIKEKIPIKLSNIFIIGFVFLFFSYFLYRERAKLFSLEFNLNIYLILGIVFLYLLIIILSSFVWGLILNHISKPLSFYFHFKIYCISALGKRIPGTIWYIPWRFKNYENHEINKNQIITASGIEYLISLFSGMLISIIFGLQIFLQYKIYLVILIVPIITFFVLMSSKVRGYLKQKLQTDLAAIQVLPLLISFAVYLFIWISVGLLIFLISHLVIDLNLSNLLFMIGSVAFTGALSRLLIFLPSNFGFTEVSLSLLLGSIMPMEFSIIIAILNRLITTMFEIILAIILILSNKNIFNPKELLSFTKLLRK